MKNNLATITLTDAQIENLEKMLNDFYRQTNVVWTMLITSSGHLLVQRGFTRTFDVLTIAALTCNIFNSTMELAHIIGEKNFSELLQEGERKSLYYMALDDNYLLVSLFDDRTIPGVVRVASEELSKNIKKILRIV
ncbi:MAG: roadblock/LC7 domain-containing protein [candidate division WOR-3 bacterium]|nr:roadblock/LC7 domain-containing protein [candidate division WOR-3 bacterium]